jgi:hypothetical protein
LDSGARSAIFRDNSERTTDTDAFIKREFRSNGSEEQIMRHHDPKSTTFRRRLVPCVALLLATALGGCVAYPVYPSGYYGYNNTNAYYGANRTAYVYPNSYSGYPGTYANSYNAHPYYSHDYNGAFSTYENSGGGADN